MLLFLLSAVVTSYQKIKGMSKNINKINKGLKTFNAQLSLFF